jgi:hypothetical protein
MLNWSTCEPSWLSTCTMKDHAVHINMAQKCHQPLTHLRNGDGLALIEVFFWTHRLEEKAWLTRPCLHRHPIDSASAEHICGCTTCSNYAVDVRQQQSGSSPVGIVYVYFVALDSDKHILCECFGCRRQQGA